MCRPASIKPGPKWNNRSSALNCTTKADCCAIQMKPSDRTSRVAMSDNVKAEKGKAFCAKLESLIVNFFISYAFLVWRENSAMVRKVNIIVAAANAMWNCRLLASTTGFEAMEKPQITVETAEAAVKNNASFFIKCIIASTPKFPVLLC